LRLVRVQRLLDEALEQGALATQEDLARVLQSSSRTIKRDFAELHSAGLYLPSRGYMKGIGRGQTHKAQIIRRWLHGETYDQLSVNSHHAVSSINRYLKTFVQVVRLHQEEMSTNQIALLLQIGAPLVQDYLNVYEQNAEAECRERLKEQLTRLCGAGKVEKGAK
jgi:Mn-dependent DtxR family transcriptional regulator